VVEARLGRFFGTGGVDIELLDAVVLLDVSLG